MVGNALSRRSRYREKLKPSVNPRRPPIFYSFFFNFWSTFWSLLEPCWDPFWDQICPRGTKMSPRGPLGSSKNQKPVFIKKWFSRGTVGIFSLLRPPKRASRGPRRLPRGTQGAPKAPKKSLKLNPKINKFCTHFGTQAGSQNGYPKTPPNKSSSQTPFPHISGVQIMPRQKINERGKKSFLTEIILYKRKGGIYIISWAIWAL